MKLEISSVVKTFGKKIVLDDVSFTAGTGAAVGLLGRNGAGKTTTIRIIMGVFPPDSGTLTLDGSPLSQTDLRFGYLPEERGLYPKQKIFNQMVYIARLRGLSRRDAEKSVDYWLDRTDMGEYKNALLNTVSKGNQQKIQLAVTMLNDPDIIILDEPFSGLDPVNAAMLKEIISERIAAGKLVIFSSHQMSYVEEFCDQIVLLDNGRIVLDGYLPDIKRSYPRTGIVISLDGCDTFSLLRDKLSYTEYGGYVRSVSRVNNHALITLNDENDRGRLLLQIISFGYPINSFSVKEPSLEEIFVDSVGEKNE